MSDYYNDGGSIDDLRDAFYQRIIEERMQYQEGEIVEYRRMDGTIGLMDGRTGIPVYDEYACARESRKRNSNEQEEVDEFGNILLLGIAGRIVNKRTNNLFSCMLEDSD